MSNGEKPPPAVYKIATSVEVAVPSKIPSFAIPDSEWDYVREKVKSIEYPSFVFKMIAAGSFGVSSTSFVTAIVTNKDYLVAKMPAYVLCCLIGVLFGIVCILCVLFDKKVGKTVIIRRDDILQEMDRVEARCRATSSKAT